MMQDLQASGFYVPGKDVDDGAVVPGTSSGAGGKTGGVEAGAAAGAGAGGAKTGSAAIGSTASGAGGAGTSSSADNPWIHITSSVVGASASSPSKAGYLGICRCQRGDSDGKLGGSSSDTCTAKFLKDADKTAACSYNTANDIACTEQNGSGKKELSDSDNTWWMQQFCKRLR